MIDLRSDTVTLPSKEMKQFILDAPLGDDVYMEDPSINSLEEYVADLFGKENALFVPSGTMANLISVLTHCERGEEVLLGDKSHIFFYEAGGISAFGGVHSHQLHNNDDGTISLNLIRKGIRDRSNIHFPSTSLMCLENTHNLCYGATIDNHYINEVKNILNENQIKLHIDGARIFNASVSLQIPIKTLVKDADSVSCCLSKGLSSPAGSLVVGNNQFIHKARKLRKTLGGGMRQAGILAAAGMYAIQNMVERLEEDHFHAQLLSEKISLIEEINIDIDKIHTNIIFFKLNKKNMNDETFLNKLYDKNVKIDYKGNHKFRMVTHMGVSKKNILETIDIFKSILQ